MREFEEVVALGDGYFSREKKGGAAAPALLLLVHFRGFSVTAIRSLFITIDGDDGTDKVTEKLLTQPKASLFMMEGVVHAGFNYVDPVAVYRATGIPVLVFQREKPDLLAVYSALERHLNDWQRKWKTLSALTQLRPTTLTWPRGGRTFSAYIQAHGLDYEEAVAFLENSMLVSHKPEQLREAKALASALGKLFELCAPHQRDRKSIALILLGSP